MTLTDWLCLTVLILSLYLAFKQKTGSLSYKYRDVIVSRWQDADFYLGKPGGTEFEYKADSSNTVWSRIAKRDKWTCWQCNKKVTPISKTIKSYWFFGERRFRVPGRREIHVDHKIAFILGGKGDTEADGITSCYRCNIRRGAKIDEMCLKRVRELGKKIYIGKDVPRYKSTRKKRYLSD